MRISATKYDAIVCIDGYCYRGIDFSFAPDGFRALQWYNTHGEVEAVDESGVYQNIKIEELGIYQSLVDQWNAKHAAALAAIEEEQNAPPPLPTVISPRQCRLILLQQGLLDAVETMIAAGDAATRITWEYATMIDRSDPLLTQMAVNLNLTEEQIDQLFAAAAQL